MKLTSNYRPSCSTAVSCSHPRSAAHAILLAIGALALAAPINAAVGMASATSPAALINSKHGIANNPVGATFVVAAQRGSVSPSARWDNATIFERWSRSSVGADGSRDVVSPNTPTDQLSALPEAEMGPAFFVESGSGEGASAGNSATTAESIDSPLAGAKAAWRHGTWDLYISGYAYHLPGYYSAARRARLNANEWGGGLGRSIEDQKGNLHQVFFLVTQDSHYKPQYFAGYSWLHPFFPDSPVQLDFGVSAFLFSRVDVANGVPLPGLLPFLTVGTKRLQLIVLYVPPIGKEIGGQTIYFYSRIQM
jgi:palmitoyl transferase